MKFIAPKSVELTSTEAKLYARIPHTPSHEGWDDVADAMESLVHSLLARDAVPEVRLQLFHDAEFAETGIKSRLEVFESNGTVGDDIYRSPYFIPYLRHFIHGPNLPRDVMDGLVAILNEDRGTSGMVMNDYRQFARAAIRDRHLSPSDAATEFFRLGVEIGMGVPAARALRDAARSTR